MKTVSPFALVFRPWLLICFFLCGATECLADEGGSVNREILAGIHWLYDWKFQEAEERFLEVRRKTPDRPTGHFYLAMVSWSRLASGFWDPGTVDEYYARIERTVEIARERVRENLADAQDLLYLGGALGFMARFKLMQNEYLDAFFLAREAVRALKACAEMDPGNRDVFLGIGIFDYYTARLSGVLKFLTSLLVHRGDKEEGLRKLHIAAGEALYSATEAKSHLSHIYLFLEEDFPRALKATRELAEKYPHNARYRFLLGVCYIRLGMENEVDETIEDLNRRGLSVPNISGSALWTRRALYLKAVRDLYRGGYKEARTKLERILEGSDPRQDPFMMGWPLLKIGMSYDLEGSREKAVERYRRVLSMRNGAGAQFLAMKYLENPPRSDDPFLGY